eukprot:TRINITY_DN49_c4_g1_i1.p1 TRINITY_DN49_c4_g1~~TRINITY_DN49_c4_g1_i1.p1  ORF type:complete len:299 (-),score=35.85 TRINITY_DN49_c4_g1_i1:47-922(-)
MDKLKTLVIMFTAIWLIAIVFFLFPMTEVVEDEPFTESNTGIALIAIQIGPSTKYLDFTALSLRSIRKTGKFNGGVYIFTNNKEYLEPYCDDNVYFIDISEMNFEDELMAKKVKTYILDFIPKKYVIYMDVDILAVKPISNVFLELNKEFLHPDYYISFSRSKSTNPIKKYINQKYHGGFWITKRKPSQEILTAWKYELERTKGTLLDQISLTKATKAYTNNIYVTNPKKWIYFPSEKSNINNDTFKQIFVHFTLHSKKLAPLFNIQFREYISKLLDLDPNDKLLNFLSEE